MKKSFFKFMSFFLLAVLVMSTIGKSAYASTSSNVKKEPIIQSAVVLPEGDSGGDGVVIEYKVKTDSGVLEHHTADFFLKPYAATSFADSLTVSNSEAGFQFILSSIVGATATAWVGIALGGVLLMDSVTRNNFASQIKSKMTESYRLGYNGKVRITVDKVYNLYSRSWFTSYSASVWDGGVMNLLSGYTYNRSYTYMVR